MDSDSKPAAGSSSWSNRTRNSFWMKAFRVCGGLSGALLSYPRAGSKAPQ